MKPRQVKTIFERFAARNPAPTTELIFHSDFELLISVMLSAQTLDARVNQVTEVFFKRANTPKAILALGEAAVAQAIKSVNYYKTKAKNIIKTCQILIDNFKGKIPTSREDLESLPGVGRKTANVVLNTAYHIPTIAVDTHLFRVAHRLGLTTADTPLSVEQDLMTKVPQAYISNTSHWLVLHGRYICVARKPKCPECFLSDLCEYPFKELN